MVPGPVLGPVDVSLDGVALCPYCATCHGPLPQSGFAAPCHLAQYGHRAYRLRERLVHSQFQRFLALRPSELLHRDSDCQLREEAEETAIGDGKAFVNVSREGTGQDLLGLIPFVMEIPQ
jgi:hypothetical protein